MNSFLNWLNQNKGIAQWATVIVVAIVGFFAYQVGTKQNSINQQQADINRQLLKIELTPSVSMRYEGGSKGDFFLSNSGKDDILIEKFIWSFSRSDQFEEFEFEEIREISQGNELPIPELLERLQDLLKKLKENPQDRPHIDGNTIPTFTLELTIKSKADNTNKYKRIFEVNVKLEDYRIIDIVDVFPVTSQ